MSNKYAVIFSCRVYKKMQACKNYIVISSLKMLSYITPVYIAPWPRVTTENRMIGTVW